MWMIHGAAPPLEMSVLPGHAAFAFPDSFCWDFQNTPPKTSGTSYTCLVREIFACFCPPELHRDTDSPVISVTNGTDDSLHVACKESTTKDPLAVPCAGSPAAAPHGPRSFPDPCQRGSAAFLCCATSCPTPISHPTQSADLFCLLFLLNQTTPSGNWKPSLSVLHEDPICLLPVVIEAE